MSSCEMDYVRVVHGVGVIRFSLEHVLIQTLAGPILLLPSFQVPAHSNNYRCIVPATEYKRTTSAEMRGRDQIRTDRTKKGMVAMLY